MDQNADPHHLDIVFPFGHGQGGLIWILSPKMRDYSPASSDSKLEIADGLDLCKR